MSDSSFDDSSGNQSNVMPDNPDSVHDINTNTNKQSFISLNIFKTFIYWHHTQMQKAKECIYAEIHYNYWCTNYTISIQKDIAVNLTI